MLPGRRNQVLMGAQKGKFKMQATSCYQVKRRLVWSRPGGIRTEVQRLVGAGFLITAEGHLLTGKDRERPECTGQGGCGLKIFNTERRRR